MSSSAEVRSLLLVLTARCNLSCGYCYQNAKNGRRMRWETLRAALDFALKSGTGPVELMFIAGEPLLEWPNLVRGVLYAGKHAAPGPKAAFAVTTHGLLITARVAAFLDDHGFELRLSFDGVPGAQDLRQPGTFDALDRLLDRLRRAHTSMFENRLRVCATAPPPAIPHLAESVRYFLDKGVRNIALAPGLVSGPLPVPDCRKDLDRQFSKIRDISLAHFKSTGEVPFLPFRKTGVRKPAGRKRRAMCDVTSGEGLLIDVDGRAHGCPMLADCYQDFPSDFLRRRIGPMGMGDFRDPGFAQRRMEFPDAARKARIFHDKELKYSSYRRCGECRHLDDCLVCPVAIGHIPGNTDPHRVPDFLCAFNLAVNEHRESFPSMPDPMEVFRSLLSRAEAQTAARGPAV